MSFELIRNYRSSGTNGSLRYGSEKICHTIELPWKENQPFISCIPEGKYLLEKRITHERGFHLILKSVPGRSWILIHPANDARTELEGCIAPVSELTGIGKGIRSSEAMDRLLEAFEEAQEKQNHIYITIKEKSTMNILERVKKPTPKLFRKLRTVGLVLAAAGGAILGAPITLPAGLITVAGYLTVGASVLTAVSQVTVDDEEKIPPMPEVKNKGDASPR
ncbi:DUF5675 family protein [uncultured Marivirga sp.]|uniref:DUF5675 family protein n=1 Tax=uncultured Marivirga sp. TaxID=1123707 RepID=UPI0030ED1D53|tara:strand:+ start:14360 stop:15022 length:663 start_codon:yes stop_codon:yes gene_type:complete